ncbi:MAG: AAA family ATPase [Phycisphaerae bacterium]|nr:AAA family ATPase [Phycisphaerae bacterium]
MSQSTALAIPPAPMDFAPPPTSSTPKIGYVLKRHRWLIAIGTALGLVISFGLFLAFHRYDPRYTAKEYFQVLPSNNSPLAQAFGSANAIVNAEVTQFINRQAVLIHSPAVLDPAIQTSAFQQNYRYPNNLTMKSDWLENHPINPVQDLEKDVSVAPIRRSALFVISMSWHDPVEVQKLVEAIGAVYLQVLQNQEKQALSQQAQLITRAQQKVQAEVTAKQQEVETYRVAHDIPGLVDQHSVQAETLAALNALLIRSEIAASQLKQDYEGIREEVKNNTLKLSPQMEQTIDADPKLSALQSSLLNLKQQYQVSKMTLGPNNRSTVVLQIQMATMEGQIQRVKRKLQVHARLQMLEHAKAAMLDAQATEVDTRRRRDVEQRLVGDLDAAVAKYENMLQTLHNQQKLLDTLTQKATIMNLRRSADASRVRLFELASVPNKPSFPILPHFLIVGLVIGVALSVGLAYLVEFTNTRVRTPRDITALLHMPMLGFVPDHADDTLLSGNPMTSVRTSPASMTAEAFRQIRGRLAAVSPGQPLRSILVASFSPGGGASTVASNLANGMALSDLRVLLVEVNFYRPILKTVYPNLSALGLTDLLNKQATMEQVIVAHPDLPNLHLMGAGSNVKVPRELSEHRGFHEVLTDLESRYDVVIFDGAPLTFVSDSVNLASRVDGVIAVLRAGVVTRGTVARIHDQLRQVNANLLGIVLNAAQAWGSGYFRQNYRTFFEYAAGQTAATPAVPVEKRLPGA